MVMTAMSPSRSTAKAFIPEPYPRMALTHPQRENEASGRGGNGNSVNGHGNGTMPSFEKSPPRAVARFDELAELIPDAARKPMFGYPALFMNGHLFFSLYRASGILRLPTADRELYESVRPITLFEPMPGRAMREYIVLPDDLFESAEVEEWIERAAANARSLPPKAPRVKKSAG